MNPMKPTLPILLVLLLGTVAAQRETADHVLDVVAFPRSTVAVQVDASGRISVPGFLPRSQQSAIVVTEQKSSKALTMRLMPIDRSDFQGGEDFIFEVLIRNAGPVTVTLPWSPDVAAFRQPVPRVPVGFRSGSISIEIEQRGVDTVLARLPGQALLGSDEVPGSLLSLEPGKTALVRLQGRWSGIGDAGAASIEKQERVRLRAVLHLDDEHLIVQSLNTVPVNVARVLR